MKTRTNTRKLVEAALLIAAALVLSIFKIADMPYGGSVTFASMLPVVLIAYRHGLGWGLGSGLVYAVLQQLLGLKTLSYVTTWQSIVAVILLDYIVAFTVCGLGGIFRGRIKRQNMALACGALFVSLLRYACHVISGATVWAGISIPTAAALGYSFIYNATYMVPETIVLVLAAYYLGSAVDFTKEKLSRLPMAGGNKTADLLTLLMGLVGVIATSVDVALIFAHLQDPESGEFSIALLKTESFVGSFWMAVVIVAVVAVVAVAAMYMARRVLMKKQAAAE